MSDPTGANLTDAEVTYLDGRDHGWKRFSVAARLQALRDDVDGSGYDFKASCVAATDAALPASTYANGTAGVGATLTGNANGALAAQDGVTLLVNERLLVKNQVAGLQNGIYVLTQVGTAGTPFILTRAVDSDDATELSPGFTVAIEEGTVNADSVWQHTTNAAITVGTTALTFSRESVDWASVSAAIASASSRADFNEQHILSGGIELEAGADLTIATGAIVPTHGQHAVITEGAPAVDTLTTITATNFVDGGLLFLQGKTAGDIITIDGSGAGNILAPKGGNVAFGVGTDDWALFIYDGTNWHLAACNRSLEGVAFGTTEDALTLSGGSITPTGKGLVSVDTEAAAATDDLDTIVATNFVAGDCIVLRPATLNQVSLFTTAGNIDFPGSPPELGHSIDDRALLMWDGTAWQVLALFSAGGAVVNSKVATVANAASPYTVLDGDNVLLADTTAGNVQFDLPAVATSAGRTLRFKKLIAANNMILDGNAAENIDGAATQTFAAQWASVDIYCDGAAWYVLG